jgi:uroporphyrin-III C-methyltransferase/precorrin-2 dehydrogenase/sirohydrochlorin ferrochelatase
MPESRRPSELREPRMRPLARLPVFWALADKRVVVAGGTDGAAWKAELLSAAGAFVDVYADTLVGGLLDLAAAPPRGPIAIHRRPVSAADLKGAALAVGAFESDADAEAFATQARSAGVPVNVVDKPAYCDFAFGSIVNRSPLVVGISTDGAAPVFAQAVRARIEAILPDGFARWAAAAKSWRALVQSSGLSFAGRRQFWQLFTKRALIEPNRSPETHELEHWLATVRADGTSPDKGSVTLVGAGPGDPELLTLRAVRALQSADVILMDDLVAPAVLDFARREAKKVLIGKTGHGPSCKQDDINAMLIALARAGRRVVRLKGGDPMLFGRAGEEIAACQAAGIGVAVIPGVTAAQAVAADLRVSLTHRDHAQRVQYVTGHGRDGKLAQDLDWAGIADLHATTVIYMPVGTLRDFVSSAISRGLCPSTPAVAMSCATRPDQKSVTAPIADLADRIAEASLPSPVTVMMGEVFAELGVKRAMAA